MMPLTENTNTANVAFDIDIKKSSSPEKQCSKIQKKLESQTKNTSPTKAELTTKLTAATTNRENLLLSKLSKINTREEKFKASKENISNEETQKLNALKLTSENKVSLASQKKSELMKKEVARVSQHNDKIKEVKSKVMEINTSKVVNIEMNTKEKITKALDNKTELTKKEVERLAEHNELVNERKLNITSNDKVERENLEKEINLKQEKALAAKTSILGNIVNGNKEKFNKAKDQGTKALEEQEVKRKELKESTDGSLVKAEVIHNEYLEKRVNHTTNTPGKASKSSTSPSRNNSPKASGEGLTKEDIDNKLLEAAARRESILLQRSEQSGMEFQKAKSKGLEVLLSPEKNKEREQVTAGKKKLHSDEEVLKVFNGEGSEGVSESEVSVDLNDKLVSSEETPKKCDIA